MGFLSKLADAVTGNWVKVRLLCSETVLGKPIEVKVSADSVKADKEIEGVYVQVVAEEKVTLPGIHVAETINGVVQDHVQDVTHTAVTFSQKYPIAGPQSLKPEQVYEWTGTISLPAEARSTYLGVNASHSWRIMAGLEIKGNDPDSGWTTITVNR